MRTITENTAKYAGGSYMQVKLVDILEPKPQDNRGAEEIIDHIKSKLRGMDKEGARE